MTLADVKRKKIAGDIATAASLLKISPANARKAFARTTSKHHTQLVEYMGQLIQAREKLIHSK